MATQLTQTDEAAEIEQDDEAQTEARDFEAEAYVKGWRTEDNWPDGKPKPSKFKTAEEFLEAEDNHIGLLRKKYEHQQTELRELKRMVKKLSASEQSAYANAMADLKAKAEDAVERGDVDEFRAIDKKLDKLRDNAEADTGDHGEDAQDEYNDFRESNVWYDRARLASASEIDIKARLFADRLADKYAKQGLTKELPPSEFFARIAKETEDKFPLLKVRGKLREKPDSPVAGVTRGAGARGAKVGANLPAEAKEHAERYMRSGIYKDCTTKEQAYARFAKDYTGPWN